MSGSDKIKRFLDITLPKGKSAFLWGPRKTGKTTLLKQKFPQSIYYDLLQTDTFLRLTKEPYRLREELVSKKTIPDFPIIIDEIQKIPLLLDEVHWLMENRGLSFILSGSSARKLKKTHANMLGGRAWRFELFPLTTRELGVNFHLLDALNHGLLPSHYFDEYYAVSLKAYIHDYLKEEIQQEGMVRNLPAFARFLDAASFSNGEMINFSNIAGDCGVDSKTVAQYYQILVDTLLGTFLEPYRKKRKRQIISQTPKFYFFDVGVAGALSQRLLQTNRGTDFGKAFEHFIFMELAAYRSYCQKDIPITYWRTKEKQEVDFVIGPAKIGIEVKSTRHVDAADIGGLKVFMEEYHPKQALLVCQETVSRQLSPGITVLPWKEFCDRLWDGDFF